jgi:hypothetical protein
VEEVLGFGYREMNYSRAVEMYKPKEVSVEHQVWANITRDYADSCNVLFKADDFVCNYMICYYSETPRVFHRIKSVTRCKVRSSGRRPNLEHTYTQYGSPHSPPRALHRQRAPWPCIHLQSSRCFVAHSRAATRSELLTYVCNLA